MSNTPNNYFTVSLPTGPHREFFCDLDERSTRVAFGIVARLARKYSAVDAETGAADGIAVSIARPVRWRLDAHDLSAMGIVGTICTITFRKDVTVLDAMCLRCSCCGVAAVVRGESAAERETQVELFEVAHLSCEVTRRRRESNALGEAARRALRKAGLRAEMMAA